MTETLKDYLVGIGFDVDESGAGKIESMLKDMDTMVQNLAKVLMQATKQVQGFVSDLQNQSKTASQTTTQVTKLSGSTQDYGKAAMNSAESARNLGNQSRGAAKDVDQLSKAMKAAKTAMKVFAGSAVVKGMISFAKSVYDGELAIEEMAKKLKKTTEQARAHNNAIKAIGKTYEEIKKDKNLKATYDDLVKLGKEMALPDGTEGLDKIREMSNAFIRLKAIGQYALQGLFSAVLKLSEVPMKRVKDTLLGLGDYLKSRAPKWIDGASKIISNVLRIATAVGSAIGDIVKFLLDLPAPIKVILGLLTVMRIMMEPKGALYIAIAGVLTLLEDFKTWQEGGESLFNWQWLVDAWGFVSDAIDNAVKSVKQFWNDAKGDDGKVNWILFGLKIGTWIVEGAKKLLSTFGSKVKGWITGDESASWEDVGGAIIDKIKGAISGQAEKAHSVIEAIFQLIREQDIGGDVINLLGNAVDFAKGILQGIVNAVPELATQATESITAIIEGIAKSINAQFTSGKVTSLIDKADEFAKGILQAIVLAIPGLAKNATALLKAFVTNIAGILNTADSSGFKDKLKTFVTNLITGLGEAIGAAGTGAGEIVKGIAEMLRTALESGQISKILGNLGDLGLQIIKAIGQGIKGAADGATDLIDSIGEMLRTALNPGENGTTIIGDLSGLGQSILSAIIQALKDVGDAATQIMTAIGNLFDGIEWEQVGVDLGNLATGLIDKLVKALGGEGIDIQGLGDAIGAALDKAADAAGTVLGTIAGKIVGYVFSKEGLTSIYEASKSVGGMIIKGIANGIITLGDFVLSTIEGVLIGLGLVDEDTFENMRQTGEKLGETLNEGIKESMIDPEGPEIDFANWAKFRVGDNDSSMDTAAQDYVQALNSAILGAAESTSTGEEFRDRILESLLTNPSEPVIELNPEDWFTVDENGDIDWSAILKNHDITAEDILPDFENLDFWGALMQAVQSGDNSQMGEVINQMLGTRLTEGAEQAAEETSNTLEQSLEEKGTDAVTEAFNAVQEQIGTSAEGLSLEDVNAKIDSVTVTEGEGTGIKDATQEAVDNILAEQTFGADVTVQTNITVSVEDSNAAEVGTTIGTEIGTSIAAAVGSTNPFTELRTKAAEVFKQISALGDAMAARVKWSIGTIPSAAGTAGTSMVTKFKDAIKGLPGWVQTEVVDKINQNLAKIKSPTIRNPLIQKNSEGCVVDSEIITRVGEEGRREYIIPVTKPNRAIPLLQKAAADLGMTVQSYTNAAKMLGGDVSRGSTPGYVATSNVSTVNNYNTNTINAPATINVRGNDSKRVADNVSLNQEALLLRNLKTVLG